MKRTFRIIALTLMAMIFLLETGFSAFAAAPSVTYEGGAEKFVFLPGSEYTDTDLFDSFKNVMPGDVLQEKIVVQNDQKKCDHVKIYLRAQTHDEKENPMSTKVASETDLASMQDFLSKLSMKVWKGSKLIYEASPDETDGLKENVLLGKFAYGEKTELTVELTVPIELDNRYMDRVGEVDWIFVAEEINDPDSAPEKTPGSTQEGTTGKPTKTGDSQNSIVWIVLAAAAATVSVIICWLKLAKKKVETQVTKD